MTDVYLVAATVDVVTKPKADMVCYKNLKKVPTPRVDNAFERKRFNVVQRTTKRFWETKHSHSLPDGVYCRINKQATSVRPEMYAAFYLLQYCSVAMLALKK